MLFSKLTKKEVIAAIAFNCSIVLSCVGGLFLILNVFSNTSDPIGQGLVIVILIPVTVMFIGAHRLLMVSFGRLINL